TGTRARSTSRTVNTFGTTLSTCTLPVTVVMASTLTSARASASINACASSTPASVSIISRTELAFQLPILTRQYLDGELISSLNTPYNGATIPLEQRAEQIAQAKW